MAEESIKKRNPLPVVIGVILLIASIVVICLLATANSYLTLDDCKTQQSDPITIAECLKQFCLFDQSQCHINCPLGFKMDAKGCPVSCDCASSGLFDGDIQFDENEVASLLEKLSGDDSLPSETTSRMSNFDLFSGSAWTGGDKWTEFKDEDDNLVKIPYIIDTKTFPATNPIDEKPYADSIYAGIDMYHNNTCIRFVHYDENNPKHKYHIRFMGDEPGCWSYVGLRKTKWQPINLGNGCGTPGTVAHEILHALGFVHEQMRPDRDSFVNVIEENITPSALKANFKKLNRHEIIDLKSEYDVNSILHYHGYSFSINQKATITDKTTNAPIIAQREKLTVKDIEELQSLYKCSPKTATATWSNWGEWSNPDVSCGVGVITRFRKCQDNGELSSGCEGEEKEIKNENLEACPASSSVGQWGPWGDWTECTKTCSMGVTWRLRECDKKICEGLYYESKVCNTPLCDNPIGSWGEWGSWSACSERCGKDGYRFRVRFCRDPQDQPALDCGFSDPEGRVNEIDGCFVPCGDAGNATAADVGFEKRGFLKGQFPSICNNGDGNFVFGDFNKDGVSDLICSLTKTTFVQYHGSSISDPKEVWKGELPGCPNPGMRFIKDANGDGIPDFVCFNPELSSITAKFSDGNGILNSDDPIDIGKFCADSVLALPVEGNHNNQLDFICKMSIFDRFQYFKRL